MMYRTTSLYILLTVAVGLIVIFLYRDQIPARDNVNRDEFALRNPADVADPANIMEISSQSPVFARPDPSATDEWLQWQTSVRQLMSDGIYELASAATAESELTVIESNRSHVDDVTRLELWIPAQNGHNIPAVLLLPDTKQSVPAVLMLPGHVKDGESGLEQMTRTMTSDHNSAALKLAQAGFATLTIELRGFGLLGPPNFPNHQIVAYNSLLAGHFYKKLAIHDIRHAFEYLRSRPDIDSSRIGVAGVSLGGELAVAYAGLDERVKAIAFHSYGGKVGEFKGIQSSDADIPHYCHIVPGSNRLFAQEDAILLLAPRPTFGTRRIQRPYARQAFLQTLESTWAALGHTDNLTIMYLPGQAEFGGHVFLVDETIQFFNDYL